MRSSRSAIGVPGGAVSAVIPGIREVSARRCAMIPAPWWKAFRMPTPQHPDPPLSFAQERLWFLDRLEPGRPTYNLPALVFRMRGSLNVAALGGALDELARRQPSLRTTFPEVDGRPVQAVAPPASFPLPVADLRALPSGRREAEARLLIAGVAWRPFDLARGPLSRALLVRLGHGEFLFILAQHHIVSDGASIDVMRRE